MAVDYKFEKNVEDDFMSVLSSAAVTAVCTPRHWKDGSSAVSYPALVVYCSGVSPAAESVRNLPIAEAVVEIGALTHVGDDADGSAAEALLALARDEVLKAALVASLSTASDYDYNDVKVTAGMNELDADNITQRSMTLTAWFTIPTT